MVNYCPECGERVKQNASFCSECGHELNRLPENTGNRPQLEGQNQYHGDEADSFTKERQEVAANPPKMPSGLGGWLILPTIGLILILVFSPLAAIGDFINSTDSELNSISGILLVDGLFFTATSILSLVLAYYYFGKYKKAVTLYIALLVLGLTHSLIIYSWSSVTNSIYIGDQGIISPSSYASDFIAAPVWIAYFSVSKRVRNTFIK